MAQATQTLKETATLEVRGLRVEVRLNAAPPAQAEMTITGTAASLERNPQPVDKRGKRDERHLSAIRQGGR